MFSTYEGIAILICVAIFTTLIIAVLLESKTKKQFKDHPIEEDDDYQDEDEQ